MKSPSNVCALEVTTPQNPPRRKRRPAIKRKPRILLVTPEIASLPDGAASPAPRIAAKSGGLADVTALLLDALTKSGADVHVALPHFRRMFGIEHGTFGNREWRDYKRKAPNSTIHLAEDRRFYYRDRVYSYRSRENPQIAMAFQREVINNILPRVDPDIIHCHDWMTGLVPGAAKRLGIPCLFTLHNIHTECISLDRMEKVGIDAAEFWESLYFGSYPACYEETRRHNPADLLASGMLASDHVNCVSPTFLDEIIRGQHGGIPDALRQRLGRMRDAGTAGAVLNAPHPSYDPATDAALVRRYEPVSCTDGKNANKVVFQERTGLASSTAAPLFFWPSRLDPTQKGCELLAEILYQITTDYGSSGLQVAFVADGPFQPHLHDIVAHHGLHDRVAVCDFDEGLSRLGYAASDFTLMPSYFEPCGLAQMVASLYGSLPVVHGTGGLRDTVDHLDPGKETGNGFVFDVPDSRGLRWAIDEAMRFYRSNAEWRSAQVARIMRESKKRFDPAVTINSYLSIYENLANRAAT